MLWFPKSQKIEKYKTIRKAGISLNSKIIQVIPKEVIYKVGKDMNMLHKNTFVLDAQHELDFLFDRIIYDVPWNGKSALEHFDNEKESELPELEKTIFEAMKGAYFSLFEVVGLTKGESLLLSDLLSDNQIVLMDISFSQTSSKGVLLATRIVKVEDIYMTAGIGYPFLPVHRDFLISGLKEKPNPQRGKKRSSVSLINYSNPRNYSLFFYKQYKRLEELSVDMSEEI